MSNAKYIVGTTGGQINLSAVVAADTPPAGYVALYSKNDKVYIMDSAGNEILQGATGAAGTSGTSGVNGTSGGNGTSGSSGTSGISQPGTPGSNGTSGTSGISQPGTPGSNGTSGTSGISQPGTPGSNGTSGTSGSSGTSGNTGSSGTSGQNGTSGTSGQNGTAGSSGTSGISGASGSSGTSGINGSSGTSGVSGSSGTSGSSGISGSSGTSGQDGASNSFFNYQSRTNTQSGNPGNGNIIWDNVTQASANSISISDTETGNINVDLFLSNLIIGSVITIQDKANHTNYQTWTITSKTDNSTYWTYGVTLVTSTHSFSGGDNVLLIIVSTPSGTSGTSGANGTSGSSGTSGTSGNTGSSGTSGTSGTTLVITNRQTASYSLVLSDASKLVEMNVGSANNLTIPLNSSQSFATGTQILVTQYGVGQTTIVPTGGVTLRSLGAATKMNGQYSSAVLIKIGTDEWDLFGNITV